MKNQYVCDIGDFGKYGLLRKMTRELKLGVIWYLTPNEPDKSDGKHTDYLDDNKRGLRECDPDLYDKLCKVFKKADRTVKEIEQAEVLPRGTIYYSEAVGDKAKRIEWFKRAMEETKECQLVFLDPDNGLTEYGTSPKHATLEEVAALFQTGKSLIIYHQLGRHIKGREQARIWQNRINGALGKGFRVEPLWYHRGTARLFFVVARSDHQEALSDSIAAVLSSRWGVAKHFTRVV